MRTLFRQAGWDRANQDTPEWNPLGGFTKPGQTVLLKPNFVVHVNPVGDLDSYLQWGTCGL